MTSRADIADYVIAGRVDGVYEEERYYTAEFFVFCVFKTNGQETKFPMVVNITVTTGPLSSPLCAQAIPQLDEGQSYIVLLTGNITEQTLSTMTVNAQEAEFNLTQENINDMQDVFGSGKTMQGLSGNDSIPKNCPSELEKMMMVNEDQEDTTMGKPPSDSQEETEKPQKETDKPEQLEPDRDSQTDDGNKGRGCLDLGSPLLTALMTFLVFISLL